MKKRELREAYRRLFADYEEACALRDDLKREVNWLKSTEVYPLPQYRKQPNTHPFVGDYLCNVCDRSAWAHRRTTS